MKYYLSEIIPRLKKYSASLDQTALLVDKPWVVSNSSDSYDKLIFRSDGRVHLSRDGEVTDGKWEYLPEARSLLIDYGNRKRLYRHQYLDEAVLALKIDTKRSINDEYFLLVDENIIPDCNAKSYLINKYLSVIEPGYSNESNITAAQPIHWVDYKSDSFTDEDNFDYFEFDKWWFDELSYEERTRIIRMHHPVLDGTNRLRASYL